MSVAVTRATEIVQIASDAQQFHKRRIDGYRHKIGIRQDSAYGLIELID